MNPNVPEFGFIQEKEELLNNSSKHTENEIIELDSNMRFSNDGNPLSRFLEHIEYRPQLKTELTKRLQGQRLIDLGCGEEGGLGLIYGASQLLKNNSDEYLPYLIKLAREAKIKSYTGVDNSPGFARYAGQIENDSDYMNEYSNALGFKIALICDEMLHYVHTLPDNSASFTLNGIAPELFFFRDRQDQFRQWFQILHEELYRATAHGGIIFGRESAILNKDELVKMGLDAPDEEYSNTSRIFLFVKR